MFGSLAGLYIIFLSSKALFHFYVASRVAVEKMGVLVLLIVNVKYLYIHIYFLWEF